MDVDSIIILKITISSKKDLIFVTINKQTMQTGFILLTFCFLFFNNPNEVPYSSIERAFIANNAEAIVQLGKDKLVLNILGKETVYNHAQAQVVLKDFFSKKPCAAFKLIFKGKETGDGCFAIGTFESKSEDFRVTLHFIKIDAEFKIESLIIEKA